MNKNGNPTLNKKKQKKFLIIWIIIISNIYISLFINLNPNNTNLHQRADFFSYIQANKYINKDNSELIYGSEIEGLVMTSIKIPKNIINKEFTLRIEADTKRIWNHTTISNGQEYCPSKDLRLEVLINGEIKRVFNYSKVPKNNYSSKMKYSYLAISNGGRRISCSIKFEANSLRNTVKIRLITNHSLREDKKIFTDYFHNDEYRLTICIGDPDIYLFISSIIFFLNWFICITVLILKKRCYVLVDYYKYFLREYYNEFRLFIKIKNQIELYLKIIFKD